MKDLVKKAQKGDKESFGLLISTVQKKAYRVAYTYLKNSEDSMDAVCDSVEVAFKKLGQLKNIEYFETWFIRIVINQCNMQLRKRKSIEKMFNKLEKMDYENNENLYSIEDKLLLREKLKNIKATDRKILFMKYWMGLKLKDIAESLQMPVGTVKTKLYGSLKSLKEDMGVEVSDEEKR